MSQPDTRPFALALMGPTASGKTQAALDVATRWPAHLISVDSALVYRHLDVGSAKPDAATRARFPHALIDICEPWQPYSAADFARDARVEIDRALAQGKMPVLVGGTGLYFRALTEGLSDLPESDPQIRTELDAELAARGLGALHARLQTLDPKAASKIHPNDPQRTLRALEVIQLTGQPLSTLQGQRRADLPVRLLKLVLCPADRGLLHARIAIRFEQMLTDGLIAEVEKLRAMPNVHADLPALRAVGYRQTWEALDGSIPMRELCDRGIFATRQLAKRQITWLRAEADAYWLDSSQADFLSELLRRVALARD
ncbi:tRNA (adenosine(37)-N6)-dimethylallyltransferase MiaA [Ahniella affigens]|uniref:tRNA dimethylallyltransferase n=1 Tax=Ahniella affigens TaxID=2021234 RepID=A0A2P1PQ11_9GAMM|nr:tRNA (adenosine(37)-N6)-dimethylallyltransferase MiaA [Ahniella affigens]AVP96925.1 tRNA (adenosine(37)-N6)-dimethylallyltransferase MiaA [Ahniella affigens]